MKPYEYYTAEEVADKLKVNVQSVWRWIREGDLPAVTFSKRTYRVRSDELEQFIVRRSTTSEEGGR